MQDLIQQDIAKDQSNEYGIGMIPSNKDFDITFPPIIGKLINLYAFLIAFPVIIIFQNISVYIFILLLFKLAQNHILYIRFSSILQKLALFFGLGVLISTINSYNVGGIESLGRSLAVLPNYLYWSLLIILLVTYREYLDFYGIFKAISFGLLCSVLYYFFVQKVEIIREFGVFKTLTQNAFAFLLICYTPLTVYYLKLRTKRIITIFFILIISVVGFVSGSRSGSILVVSGALLAYYLSDDLSKKRIVPLLSLALLGFLLFATPMAENLIKRLNQRTYALIYSPEDTFSTDRSYLLRKAMVEKGLYLFAKNPVAGIGLNNFTEVPGVIEGNFEGAEYIIHKDIKTGKSAHNSYISLLSEGGLVVSIPFLLILLYIFFNLLIRFGGIDPYARAVFFGIILMAIHLYFISAILNVFAWFLIGLAAAMVSKKRPDHSMEGTLQTDESSKNL
jgi:O-antigen ligase